MAKPTLVLVHGSWHSPEHFELLIPLLSRNGYKCVAVGLPSTQSPDLPPRTLANDTAAVRDAVVAELKQGNDVVVVAHSYGGAPSNNALKGLDVKSRKAEGHESAVTALVLLCAIPLEAGKSFIGTLGGKPHPVHDLTKSKDFVYVASPGPGHYFYNDLSKEMVDKYLSLIHI